MGKTKLVVFDMAGTTVRDNKEVETCFAKACEQTGLEVSEERILALQGYSKIEVFRMLWEEKTGKNDPNYESNVMNSYDFFRITLENHYIFEPIIATEYCLETFGFLRENDIKIALTTGFYRKVGNIILEKLGWVQGLNDDYFNESGDSVIDLSICSDEVLAGRPTAFMINKAISKFNISNPNEVINIGDTPSDLASGFNAKVYKSLGLTNGTHTREQLEKYPNDGLLNNLSELKNYLVL
jgi:phosphonatase-like hydrolase